jgi:NitT/TauT family transport system permease protein
MRFPRNFAPLSVGTSGAAPSRWDVLAVLLVLAVIVVLAESSQGVFAPLQVLATAPVTLDPANLPAYAGRTALRMLAAMLLSLLFTFTYATLAARSRRAETVLIPLLDILQSVPILGFISITVVWFMSLAPGRVLGAELASVFAIFTSQAWNMAFSFYQSLRSVPNDLVEASKNLQMSPWMRFWRVDAPFAAPALVWNMMMSMSGGWFFVVASESISVGHTNIALPGIGSYIALAIRHQNLAAVGWAILAMLLVILVYDQIMFRPLVAWSARFRYEQEAGEAEAQSWVLAILRRSAILAALRHGTRAIMFPRRSPVAAPRRFRAPGAAAARRWQDRAWAVILAALAGAAAWAVVRYTASSGIGAADVADAVLRGGTTLLRVVVLIALASLVWVPAGIWAGLRPRWTQRIQPLVQFLAAFPANVLFPIAVSAIIVLRLDPDVWLSPLMVLGTQWYILFNVIAGASTIPSELRDAGANFQVRGWLWWRKVALPAIFPYYLTGAITAAGGSWNASIVAEAASWGTTKLTAYGLGSYIAEATDKGDFPRIVLGIAIMSAFVVLLNRLFWRPLYLYAEKRFRMG